MDCCPVDTLRYAAVVIYATSGVRQLVRCQIHRNSDSPVTLGYRTLRPGLFRGLWTGSCGSRMSTNESVRVKRDPHRLRGLTAPPNIAMYVAGNLRLYVADLSAGGVSGTCHGTSFTLRTVTRERGATALATPPRSLLLADSVI